MMTATTSRVLEPLERRSASAFVLAGVLIFASLFVPVGLESLTDWSWASGLVLLGFAVIAVSVGLVGLYPQVRNYAPAIALAGAGAAAVAGVAALALVGLVGVGLGNQLGVGPAVSEPMPVFVLLGLVMTGGFSLGLLCFGVAIRRTDASARQVRGLLLAGGFALLVPVLIEVVRRTVGVRIPLWVLFPMIVAVALDTLKNRFRDGRLGRAFSPPAQRSGMSRHTGMSALIAALRDRRRNVAALCSVVSVLAIAALVGTKEAYYLASLIVFTIWMVWFVLTGIEWVRLAEF